MSKRKKLTQAQLAEKAGMGVATIIRYEKGERTPNLETINKIASALEMPIDELMYNVPMPVSDNITHAMETLAQQITSGKETLNKNFDKLNSIGKQKALDYVIDLSEQEKYTKPDEE